MMSPLMDPQAPASHISRSILLATRPRCSLAQSSFGSISTSFATSLDLSGLGSARVMGFTWPGTTGIPWSSRNCMASMGPWSAWVSISVFAIVRKGKIDTTQHPMSYRSIRSKLSSNCMARKAKARRVLFIRWQGIEELIVWLSLETKSSTRRGDVYRITPSA